MCRRVGRAHHVDAFERSETLDRITASSTFDGTFAARFRVVAICVVETLVFVCTGFSVARQRGAFAIRRMTIIVITHARSSLERWIAGASTIGQQITRRDAAIDVAPHAFFALTLSRARVAILFACFACRGHHRIIAIGTFDTRVHGAIAAKSHGGRFGFTNPEATSAIAHAHGRVANGSAAAFDIEQTCSARGYRSDKHLGACIVER